MRRTLFFWALALLCLAFLLEVGGGSLLTPERAGQGALVAAMQDQGLAPDAAVVSQAAALDQAPGFGIRALALVDGLLLLSLGLLVVAMFVRHDLHGRLVGIVSLVGGLLVVLLGLALLFSALASLMLMLGLLLGGPFAVLTYVARYGFFDRAGAGTILGMALACKIGFVVLALAAYPRFLREKGLVLLTLTSIGALLLVSFLHGLVPRLLVSITDAVAAIIVAIVAIVWAVVLMIGSLGSIVRALRLRRA